MLAPTNPWRRFWPGTVPGLLLATGLLVLVITLLLRIAALADWSRGLLGSLGNRDWQVLQISVLQAGLSLTLSLMLGVALAWSLSHQRRFPGRPLLVGLLSSALVLPGLVVVLGLISVLGRNGWLNNTLAELGLDRRFSLYGLGGILIAHVYLNASFTVRSVLARLEAIPSSRRKLVRSLGLSPWQRFRLIEWPAIAGAVPPLAVTIFLLCFTSFAIVLVLGGSPRYNTLEVAIFEAVKLDFDLARAFDLALLQLIICGVLVVASTRLGWQDASIGVSERSMPWREPAAIRMVQWLIITLCSAAVLLPLLAVGMDGARAEFARLLGEPAFQRAFATSMVLASVSALLVCGIGVALATARHSLIAGKRLARTWEAAPIVAVMGFSSTLYLAFPAVVLGLGFFLLARDLPGGLALWAWFALVTANILLALPFALAILNPAVEKTLNRYDRLMISLSLSSVAQWHVVLWPLLRRDLGTVFAIAFCFSLGDLGVIALFGSQDFATLPWYLYQKLGSYRTDDAAGVALIMLVLTLSVFMLVPRLFNDGGERRA